MLGLDFNDFDPVTGKNNTGKKREKYSIPIELKLEDFDKRFNSHLSNTENNPHEFAKNNPFKRKKKGERREPMHEGFNMKTLIVNNYKKNTSIYSSHKIVQSQASQSKMELIEVKRQN